MISEIYRSNVNRQIERTRCSGGGRWMGSSLLGMVIISNMSDSPGGRISKVSSRIPNGRPWIVAIELFDIRYCRAENLPVCLPIQRVDCVKYKSSYGDYNGRGLRRRPAWLSLKTQIDAVCHGNVRQCPHIDTCGLNQALDHQ